MGVNLITYYQILIISKSGEKSQNKVSMSEEIGCIEKKKPKLAQNSSFNLHLKNYGGQFYRKLNIKILLFQNVEKNLNKIEVAEEIGCGNELKILRKMRCEN